MKETWVDSTGNTFSRELVVPSDPRQEFLIQRDWEAQTVELRANGYRRLPTLEEKVRAVQQTIRKLQEGV